MIPEKMVEVLKHEGVVAIVTQGDEDPHVANTWNSYLRITEEGKLLVPAGRMNVTENNLKKRENLLVTLGSREVDGFHSKGTGFLIEGSGEFLYEGEDYNTMKTNYPWLRATLEITPIKITQTL